MDKVVDEQYIVDQSTYTLEYVDYTDESVLADIQRLVAADLSEPYSVFTYRYFLNNWPKLCICVYANAVGEKESDSIEIRKSKRIMIGISYNSFIYQCTFICISEDNLINSK